MEMFSAYLGTFVLFAAGVMELFAMKPDTRLTALLCAFGFLMLGARYAFLIYAADIGRLSIYGTGSIGAIALARIMACADELRR